MTLQTSWSGKVPENCTTVKDDDQQQNGVKIAGEGVTAFDRWWEWIVPCDVIVLLYGVVNFVGKL